MIMLSPIHLIIQKTLIDMAVECMPNIKSVQIKSARSEMDRGATCGTGAWEYSSYVYKRMVESVGDYAAPPSCQQLPSLTVGIKTIFMGERNSSGDLIMNDGNDGKAVGAGLLKYVDKTPKNETQWYDFLF